MLPARPGLLLTDERDYEAIDVAERFADDLANRRQLREASRQAARLYAAITAMWWPTAADAAASVLSVCSVLRAEATGDVGHPKGAGDFYAGEQGERAAQCWLLRDIIGSPSRDVRLDRYWHTSTAVALAQSIYAERTFDRLPILADALEEAGCGNADVLAHCRGDGPHVRGCWVVDLVLGKT